MLGTYFKGYFAGANENNLLETYFSVHMEPAGEAPGSPGVKSNTLYSGVTTAPADLVHDLVPGEGRMINPITGEYNIFLSCYIFLINL